MEEKSPPPPARTRKPRSKPTARAADEASPAPAKPKARRAPENGGAAAGTGAAYSSPSADGGRAAPPVFDHLIHDDGFVRDFDRLASENPKSAVLTALAVGVAIGFVAGILLARD